MEMGSLWNDDLKVAATLVSRHAAFDTLGSYTIYGLYYEIANTVQYITGIKKLPFKHC